ncbi:hypothetical protein ABSA28_00813 [Candidatus Hepatincolaceae symbiont of Richtersius coronifer]
MTFKSIVLRNEQSGEIRLANMGYSFSLLLSIPFSAWVVPFFKKDYLYALLIYGFILIYNISYLFIYKDQLNNYVAYTLTIIYFSILIIFAFFYNKIHINSLFKKGYKIINIEDIFDQNIKNKILTLYEENVLRDVYIEKTFIEPLKLKYNIYRTLITLSIFIISGTFLIIIFKFLEILFPEINV